MAFPVPRSSVAREGRRMVKRERKRLVGLGQRTSSGSFASIFVVWSQTTRKPSTGKSMTSEINSSPLPWLSRPHEVARVVNQAGTNSAFWGTPSQNQRSNVFRRLGSLVESSSRGRFRRRLEGSSLKYPRLRRSASTYPDSRRKSLNRLASLCEMILSNEWPFESRKGRILHRGLLLED